MPKTNFIAKSLTLIFPVHCLGCRREGDWVCQDCRDTLTLSRPAQCALCAKAAVNGLCEKCRNRTGLKGAVSLFAYKESLAQKIIKEIKYRGHFDAGEFLAKYYRRNIIQRLPEQDFLVTFVPLSRKRLAERGFNQSQVLATEFFADSWPVLPTVKKTIETMPQAGLKRVERLKNLRKSFQLTVKTVPEFVLIVDDVITTGTTLSRIAKLLKKRGAKHVWAVTVAHG